MNDNHEHDDDNDLTGALGDLGRYGDQMGMEDWRGLSEAARLMLLCGKGDYRAVAQYVLTLDLAEAQSALVAASVAGALAIGAEVVECETSSGAAFLARLANHAKRVEQQ